MSADSEGDLQSLQQKGTNRAAPRKALDVAIVI